MKQGKRIPQSVVKCLEQGDREAGQPPALEILKTDMEKAQRFLILLQIQQILRRLGPSFP